MICPICGGRIKVMEKPDPQYHCRGECGLILRVQSESFYDKLKELVVEKLKSPNNAIYPCSMWKRTAWSCYHQFDLKCGEEPCELSARQHG